MIDTTSFDVATLRTKCVEVLGVEPYIFDGAFFNATGKYTITEAKARIDKWLKAPIKRRG